MYAYDTYTYIHIHTHTYKGQPVKNIGYWLGPKHLETFTPRQTGNFSGNEYMYIQYMHIHAHKSCIHTDTYTYTQYIHIHTHTSWRYNKGQPGKNFLSLTWAKALRQLFQPWNETCKIVGNTFKHIHLHTNNSCTYIHLQYWMNVSCIHTPHKQTCVCIVLYESCLYLHVLLRRHIVHSHVPKWPIPEAGPGGPHPGKPR